MNPLKYASVLLLFGFIACTQFLESDDSGKNIYSGDDGCIYCHTNEGRLKVLAPAEAGGEGAGGG